MSLTTCTSAEATMPDHIARAVVLPESYLDEQNISYPAFKWLRENNPLGVARVEGYDPLWILSKFDDIQTVESRQDVFGVGDQSPILNTQAGDAFIRAMTGGSNRSADILGFMDAPEHTKIRRIFNPWFRPNNV